MNERAEGPTTIAEASARLNAYYPVTLELASIQLDVRPLHTLESTTPLTENESQRLNRLALVLERATQVHKTAREAATWCLAELPALGRQTPIQKCQTEEGYQRVLGLLSQIEHGIFG